MATVTDDEMIRDIQRVSHSLNTNHLSLEEYLRHGGKYSADIIDDPDCGGFAGRCELAGVKVKIDKS